MRLLALALLLAAAALPLAAATAKDLIGTWVMDTDATWEVLKDLPQIKALPPELNAAAKSALVTQSAGMSFVFTADRLTTTTAGVKRDETYTVVATEGDTITTESVDDQGHKERSVIRFENGRMILTSVSDPMQKAVLKKQ
jgi:hypothetical protein